MPFHLILLAWYDERFFPIDYAYLEINSIQLTTYFQPIKNKSYQVSDAFKVSLTADAQVASYFSNSHSYQTPDFFDGNNNGTDCTTSGTINFDTLDVDYKALQYSMLITTIFEVVGAFFFFVTAWSSHLLFLIILVIPLLFLFLKYLNAGI